MKCCEGDSFGLNHKTFYGRNLQIFVRLLVPFQPSLMFVGEARSYPILEHLKGASLG